ncbi:Tungsten-containing formylmethanofuran dehydrogenase, subunit A [Granulibacter bethesdensis]|uniref:Tungsten-containing formylmethanofuran dehydrogenase, subunit A n=1 Tax=Granulibacter bethesdensis TaxID=364410 RepID=A0AAN0RCZ8_9PROT|nr:formylmethanofuran dehydrogenase subunit A [Granulibacter bethesdensis]AHJ62599.1 Tungsten-containing formylmethanofuran dehydrogenase, subunit A [Granulibacter bethesdensis]
MLTVLKGGRIVDPARDRDEVADLWLQDGRIVEAPANGRADEVVDVSGCVVMAGGIDIHSHIAGTNVNTAKLLLPELIGQEGGFDGTPIPHEVGRLYVQMGFTTVVEPAISPHVAVQAHAELSRIPFIDTATLTVLGNDDYFLRLVRDGESDAALADYVARNITAARGLGLKVINPGGAAAFKENLRSFSLDDEVPSYGVSSRQIFKAAQRARDVLGIPHPVHLHCNNLGMAGNVETAIATMDAAEGLPVHFAHLQFYSYGTEGPRKFSSAAARLAEEMNSRPNVTADVGQVMFGQTVTISSDVLRQFDGRVAAFPRKWSILDGDGNGGGVVPYRYKRTSFVNALQWAAGLELFLLVNDPWRLFFTTDHPNGAPFTAYPDLMALLMSRDLRAQWMETLPKDALDATTLPSLNREYDWREIAIMTRAAPARLLGLSDRGNLAIGSKADVSVYRPQEDRAAMFREAAYVFRNGELVVKDGSTQRTVFGTCFTLQPEFDRGVDRRLKGYYEQVYGVPHTLFDVPGHLKSFETVECAQ